MDIANKMIVEVVIFKPQQNCLTQLDPFKSFPYFNPIAMWVNTEYNTCSKRRQKQGLIGLFVVTLFVVGVAIALIVIGYDDQDYAQDLKENSSLDDCEIIETKL